MNVVITGITGFVGKKLTAHLMGKYDCSLVGAGREKRSDIQIPFFSVGEFSTDTDWRLPLKSADIVIHLASRAHILKESSQDALSEFRRVNVDATVALATQAAESGVKRFVFISSIGVNGEISQAPFAEHDTPNPVSPYAISKLEAERELRKIADNTSMEVVIIRPPLVYGNGAPGNFARLLKCLKSKLPLPLGAVHNKRSFVGVNNLIDFIGICACHSAAANQVFLVSDDHDISTTDFLKKILRAINSTSFLIPVPVSVIYFFANILGKTAIADRLCNSLQIDIAKAKSVLGWSPPFSIDEQLIDVDKDF